MDIIQCEPPKSQNLKAFLLYELKYIPFQYELLWITCVIQSSGIQLKGPATQISMHIKVWKSNKYDRMVRTVTFNVLSLVLSSVYMQDKSN